MTNSLTRDFSQTTLKGLAQKGINIVDVQAVPAFEGDEFFTGRAYGLNLFGAFSLKTHAQVREIAAMTEDELSLSLAWDDEEE